MLISRDVPVPTDDGVVLRADVFRPVAPGRYPVIASMGPYAKSLPFQQGFPERWSRLLRDEPSVTEGSSCVHQNWETVDPEQWVPHGYAVVRVDSRGAGRSPGVMDLWSPREAKDYSQAIEWAGRQPWSNGRVGLCGISYYAMNQWQVAALRPPHLAAMIPWEGAVDHYRDMTHHGGILSNGFFDGWYPRQVVSVQHGRGSAGPPSPWTDDGLACGPETLTDDELAAQRVDYLQAIRSHPLDDDWYHGRTPDLAAVEVPLLSAANWGGLGLHSRGNFDGFLGTGSAAKWLEVHTGRHEQAFYTADGRARQLRFFDRFLKGIDNGWDDEPRVTLSVRHVDRTVVRRGESGWPLPRTRWERWHLDAGGPTLSPNRPTGPAQVGFDGLGDGVTFTSPPLSRTTELTGPLAATLVVRSSGTDGDLFLTLRAFGPDGDEVTFAGANDPEAPLSQGWLRISHRALDLARSHPWRPWHPHDRAVPVSPGSDHRVEVEMWPTCVVLPAGYRLALLVASRDFARPGATGQFSGSGPFRHDDAEDRPPAAYRRELTLTTGGETGASLLLPIID